MAMHIIGVDVRKVLSAPSFYRHAKALNEFGYDVRRQISTLYAPETDSVKLAFGELWREESDAAQ
jgi:hypothetical protein